MEPADLLDLVPVPHADVASDTLRNLIESFVLREGTDYGEQLYSLEQKVAHVLRQLQRGEAQVVFDPNTETIDIVVPEVRRRTPKS